MESFQKFLKNLINGKQMHVKRAHVYNFCKIPASQSKVLIIKLKKNVFNQWLVRLFTCVCQGDLSVYFW